jgi:peroxiredoxin
MKWRSLQESGLTSDGRALREVFAERKASIARYVPADVQAVHTRTVSRLKAESLTSRVPQPGTKAPSFEIADQNGTSVASGALLEAGPVVLMFIRGRWCPFCVAQMEAMSSLAPQFEASGASLVAVSPQTGRQAYFMHNQHRFGFPLLVDTGNRLARQFGLVYRVPEEQQALYARTFVNLPFVNGDSSWELPVPATFVIVSDGAAGDTGGGTIRFAAASEDYTDRPEPLEVLAAVRDLS